MHSRAARSPSVAFQRAPSSLIRASLSAYARIMLLTGEQKFRLDGTRKFDMSRVDTGGKTDRKCFLRKSSFQNQQHKTNTASTTKMPISNGFNPAAVLRPIQSAVGASFLYPLKGIYYYLSHPFLWALFGRRLIPLVVVSIVVLGLLFTFAYLPQVAFLAIFHGHLAWFNAAFLVLGEGQVVIALLFEALLVDETLVNVFDVRFVSPSLQSLRCLLPSLTTPDRTTKAETKLINELGRPH